MIRLCIHEVAARKKVSMGQLSRLANVTPGVLRDARDYPEEYNIGLRTLEKIASVLQVKVCDLFVEEDTPPAG